MPINRKQKMTHRANVIAEARSGLMPEADNLVNEISVRTSRTQCIIRKAKNHLGSSNNIPDETAITNVLSDIRHYCCMKGIAFNKINRIARNLYLEEKEYELRSFWR